MTVRQISTTYRQQLTDRGQNPGPTSTGQPIALDALWLFHDSCSSASREPRETLFVGGDLDRASRLSQSDNLRICGLFRTVSSSRSDGANSVAKFTEYLGSRFPGRSYHPTMGLSYCMLTLKNPRSPQSDPVDVEALADTGAVYLIIPEHIRLQLALEESSDERDHPSGWFKEDGPIRGSN